MWMLCLQLSGRVLACLSWSRHDQMAVAMMQFVTGLSRVRPGTEVWFAHSVFFK